MALFDSSKYEIKRIVLSLGPSCCPETQDTLASQLPLEWWDCSYVSFPGGSVVKNLPAKQETRVRSLGREDPLEKEMATHSRILAWETSWAEEPGGLYSSWGHKELDMTQQLNNNNSLLCNSCFPSTDLRCHFDYIINPHLFLVYF